MSLKAMLDIHRIRKDFPILQSEVYGSPLVYLDNAATTQKPLEVITKVVEYYNSANANIHRGAHYLSDQAGQYYESARESVRTFINASSVNEIVFTRGTTESLNTVADCFGPQRVSEGDEVLITEMEHHSNLIPWQVLCRNQGAKLSVVRTSDTGSLDMDNFRNLISERTKLLAVTHVSNVLGTINPLKELITAAHALGVPVVVDGAQGISHQVVDVWDLDCDFYAFSGHKIYAETGIGVLYGKEKWLENMPPRQYGGGMVESVSFNGIKHAGLPFKFEAGTPNIAGALSLGEALSYIKKVGFDNIMAREEGLLYYAMGKLSECGDVKIYGSHKPKCGAISFNLAEASSFDIALILDKMGIAVRSGHHCAEPLMHRFGIKGTVRASFAFYNTREEIDLLLQGVEKARGMLL